MEAAPGDDEAAAALGTLALAAINGAIAWLWAYFAPRNVDKAAVAVLLALGLSACASRGYYAQLDAVEHGVIEPEVDAALPGADRPTLPLFGHRFLAIPLDSTLIRLH